MNAELREFGHDRRIEARDRVAGERKMLLRAVAGGNPQGVIEKVEFDLEGACAIRNRRGRQPASSDV